MLFGLIVEFNGDRFFEARKDRFLINFQCVGDFFGWATSCQMNQLAEPGSLSLKSERGLRVMERWHDSVSSWQNAVSSWQNSSLPIGAPRTSMLGVSYFLISSGNIDLSSLQYTSHLLTFTSRPVHWDASRIVPRHSFKACLVPYKMPSSKYQRLARRPS